MYSYATRSRKKMKQSINCLPPELLFEVLSYLPAKDLLKLRVVCKLWNSIICDRSFQQHHLDQLRKNNINGCKYLVSSSSGFGHCIRSVNIRSSDNLAITGKIELYKSQYDCALDPIKGCVDGVFLVHTFCFDIHQESLVFLWNPTLGKIVDIPLYGSLKKMSWNHDSGFVFGFGFDSVSNIYKVVALHLQKNDLETMVYNLGSCSWTSHKIEASSIHNVSFVTQNSRSLNFEGCVYWLARGNNGAHYYLCFNLSSEALTCCKLPDNKHDGRNNQLLRNVRKLSVLYDSLAVVDTSFDYGSSYKHIRVWMRRKNDTSSIFSWVELYNLDFLGKDFLYLTNNGNLYLRSRSRLFPMTTFVYDLKTGKEKVCSETQGYINFMDGYLESLALLR